MRRSKYILPIFYIIILLTLIFICYSYYLNTTNFYINNEELKISIDTEYKISISSSNKKYSNNTLYNYRVEDDSVLKINNEGNIIPKKIGSTYIYVKSKKNKVEKKLKVSIIDEPITSIKIKQKNININVNDQYQLDVIINDDTTKIYKVNYMSYDENIVRVDDNGKLTGISEGNTTIIVQTKNGLTDKCNVVVKNKSNNESNKKKPSNSNTKPSSNNQNNNIYADKVTLSTNYLELKVGTKVKLSASISPSNTTDKKIIWSSSNSNIASVDQNGNVIAHNTGTVNIVAKTNNGKSSACSIKVISVAPQVVEVSSIKLNKTNVTLYDEKNTTVTATISPNNATDKTIIWISSNPSIATVSNGKIIAKSPGTTTVSARATNGKSASVTVTVKAYEIALVGNSKTYYNNLDGVYKEMLKNRGYSANVKNITKGGKTLTWHYNNSKTQLKKYYDIAIIQDQANNVESKTDSSYYKDYLDGATNVSKLLRSGNKNVKIYLRETWPLVNHRSGTNDTRSNVYNNAKTIGKSISATVIKDGEAWNESNSKYPSLNLYADERHQNNAGAYLTAACMYKKTFGDPIKITYYGKISETTAKNMLNIANKIC